jgi:hypothetical protein
MQMATNDPMLTGLFRDRDSAERAYQSISDRGYSRDDVNVVMSDETRKRHFSGSAEGARPSSAPRPPKAPASAARSAAAWARSPRPSPPSARRSRCPASAWSSPARSRLRSPAPAPARRPAASSAR